MNSNRFTLMEFLTSDGFLVDNKTTFPFEDVARSRRGDSPPGASTQDVVSVEHQTVSSRQAQKVSRIRQEHPQPLAGNPTYDGTAYAPSATTEPRRALDEHCGFLQRALDEPSLLAQHAKRRRDNTAPSSPNVHIMSWEQDCGLVPDDTTSTPASRVNHAEDICQAPGLSRQCNGSSRPGRPTPTSLGRHTALEASRTPHKHIDIHAAGRSREDGRAQLQPTVTPTQTNLHVQTRRWQDASPRAPHTYTGTKVGGRYRGGRLARLLLICR